MSVNLDSIERHRKGFVTSVGSLLALSALISGSYGLVTFYRGYTQKRLFRYCSGRVLDLFPVMEDARKFRYLANCEKVQRVDYLQEQLLLFNQDMLDSLQELTIGQLRAIIREDAFHIAAGIQFDVLETPAAGYQTVLCLGGFSSMPEEKAKETFRLGCCALEPKGYFILRDYGRSPLVPKAFELEQFYSFGEWGTDPACGLELIHQKKRFLGFYHELVWQKK